MKRTMKKHLSLILAVLMLLTSVGFSAVAAGNCIHQPDFDDPAYARVTNPTCEKGGYTEYLCVLCGEVASVGNYKDALGHEPGEEKYEPVDKNDLSKGYNKYTTCTRSFMVNGNRVDCDSKSYEIEADGSRSVYYLVTFVNDKATDKYYSNIKYTNVVESYAEPVVLQQSYVKKGDEAIYEGSAVRTEKTKEYGRYLFIGWSTEPVTATAKDNLDVEDCDSLKNITANTTFYPVFSGVTLNYTVSFFNTEKNEPFVYDQEIQHGMSPTYRVNGDLANDFYDDPVKAEDVVYTYEFAGWVDGINYDNPISMEEVETTPIYGKLTYYPVFTGIKKLYNVSFCDSDKNVIKRVENLTLKSNLNLVEEIAQLKPSREDDKTYMYTWTGKWQILKADGTVGAVVDIRNFLVDAGDFTEIKDKNGTVLSREIKLVPVYNKTLIRYAVDIEMGVPLSEDMDYYRGEAEVQVIANNGQLIAAGKTDANGLFRCYLNYQVPFTVNVASYEGKYIGTAIITELYKSPKGDEHEAANLNHVYVTMDKNPEYETHCSCIHHNSLLQPIIVRIYNILYTFFNYKYVCCYDMYSTIGPLLEYTAG